MAKSYVSKIDEVKQAKEQMDYQLKYDNLNNFVMHNKKIEKQLKKKNLYETAVFEKKKEKTDEKFN